MDMIAEGRCRDTEGWKRKCSMRNQIEWIIYWIYEWIVLWREDLSYGKGYCLMNRISNILEMDSLLWMLCCDQDAWAKMNCSAFSIVVTVSHGQLQGVMCTVYCVCALCILCDSYVGCAYLCVAAFHNSIMKISSSNYPRTWWTQ